MWFRKRVTKEDFDKSIKQFKQAFSKIKSEQKKQNEELIKHSEQIQTNSMSLEALVIVKPTSRPTKQLPKPQLVETHLNTGESINTLRINDFTEKEKGILNTLFQNKDMSLSYLDISKVLDKSPNTIKNQIREINMKSEVLEETTDSTNRKRFTLKKGLIIEKPLD